MTTTQYLDKMMALVSGGIISDENRWSYPYLETLLNSFRQEAILIIYNGNRGTAKNKRLNPIYYQKHYPVFRHELQDEKCVTKFECPEIVTLDEQGDGLRYCGTIDRSQAFNRIHSRRKLSDIDHHKVMKTIMLKDIGFLYDGNTQLIEIYGNNSIEETLIEGVFTNPFSVPTFNKSNDAYPICEQGMGIVEGLVRQRAERLTPIDTVNDGKEAVPMVRK